MLEYLKMLKTKVITWFGDDLDPQKMVGENLECTFLGVLVGLLLSVVIDPLAIAIAILVFLIGIEIYKYFEKKNKNTKE